MPMTPSITVEAAWSNSVTGYIVIGSSTIESEDAVGGEFAFNSYTSIPEVQEFTITRGRSNDLSTMQASTCVLKLFDSTAKYNPLNTGSVLYGSLQPMRPIRIRATHPITGTQYTIFYGFILTIEFNGDPAAPVTTIECVDLFEWLNNSYPTVSAMTNEDCGTVIGAILTAIGWTQPDLVSMDATGKAIPSFSASGAETALSLIQDLLEIDRGVFYIARDGIATYKSHGTLSAVETSAATFTSTQAGAMRPSTQARMIINGQSVTKTGNSAQTATDTTSRRAYGKRDGPAITSAYLNNDSQADSLARVIVAEHKDPLTPARPVQLMNVSDSTGDVLTQQLTRDIADYVTVSDGVYGTAISGHIDQITHRCWDGGTALQTNILITKKNATAITIGTSTIGSAHIVGY